MEFSKFQKRIYDKYPVKLYKEIPLKKINSIIIFVIYSKKIISWI